MTNLDSPQTSGPLFWLSKLDDSVPRAQIVPDIRRNGALTHEYRACVFSVDADVVRTLRSLDRARGVSDIALCTALVAMVLSKYQRGNEMIIGLQSIQSVSGTTPVLPLKIEWRESATGLDFVSSVADEVAEVLSRAPSPPNEMAQILGVELSTSKCPFFDVALAIGDGSHQFDFQSYPVDLAFLFDVSAGAIRGNVTYAADLFRETSIQNLLSHLATGAARLSQRPNAPLSVLDVIPSAERQMILHDLRGRASEYPLDKTLHGLFEEQAGRQPKAIAVLHNGTAFTFEELNGRANRVARTLISLGARKGEFVGLLLNRGFEFVVAMLAVF
jgi:non-ribosomal peptide synthetase component F